MGRQQISNAGVSRVGAVHLLTNDVVGERRALYRAVVNADLEGIVVKHLAEAPTTRSSPAGTRSSIAPTRSAAAGRNGCASAKNAYYDNKVLVVAHFPGDEEIAFTRTDTRTVTPGDERSAIQRNGAALSAATVASVPPAGIPGKPDRRRPEAATPGMVDQVDLDTGLAERAARFGTKANVRRREGATAHPERPQRN